MSTEVLIPSVVGEGSPDRELLPATLADIVEQALAVIEPGERVLAIVPDKTRDDNTDLLFPITQTILREREVKSFDVLRCSGRVG